jgi:hypothetical protein
VRRSSEGTVSSIAKHVNLSAAKDLLYLVGDFPSANVRSFAAQDDMLLLAAGRCRIALRPIGPGPVIHVRELDRRAPDERRDSRQGVVVDVLRLVGELVVVDMQSA